MTVKFYPASHIGVQLKMTGLICLVKILTENLFRDSFNLLFRENSTGYNRLKLVAFINICGIYMNPLH